MKMFTSVKKFFKLGLLDQKIKQNSLLLAAFIKFLEDVILWKKMWLSLSCVLIVNIVFLVCIFWEINFLQFTFCLCAIIITSDAFETWLKYKHRTGFLKRFANHDFAEFNKVATNIKVVSRKKWTQFCYLRETNHTKAYLLLNIIFSIIFLIGKYVSGTVLLYVFSMVLIFLRKTAPLFTKFMARIQQHAESDGELDGLIPDVGDVDLKLLSIEPEPVYYDEKQSLDYWKPDDIHIDESSDSSEHSTSTGRKPITDNMVIDKDLETSDSSEDEYIPLNTEQNKEYEQSTLEGPPSSSWSSSAYNALFNITSAMGGMMYSAESKPRKRMSSADSSDGFELIDKNDLN